MPPQRSTGTTAVSLLLNTLVQPSKLRGLSESDWDVLVRVARASTLVSTIGTRIESAGMMSEVPTRARAQLLSERAVTDYRARLVWWELERLVRALNPLGTPVVLLKGAAYIAQGLACAAGRTLSDVDILVPRERLPEVERALLSCGWEATPLEPYDDRYYRQWSHEIPPLRYGGSALELDVHHAILPPLGRVRPDPTLLMNRSIAVLPAPLRVLAPEDQVLHAALHLFQDSDCTNRLRDIVDIDALIREFCVRPSFWSDLVAHAAEYGAGRALWYALRYTRRYAATPVPEWVADQLRSHAPPPFVRKLMDALVESALTPPDPDRGYTQTARLASRLLLTRAAWLRFPPRLFFLHSVIKAVPWLRPAVARPQAT